MSIVFKCNNNKIVLYNAFFIIYMYNILHQDIIENQIHVRRSFHYCGLYAVAITAFVLCSCACEGYDRIGGMVAAPIVLFDRNSVEEASRNSPNCCRKIYIFVTRLIQSTA